MVEDRRAILAAEIEALAVAGGRVVVLPEHLKQLRVADLGRVEPYLDRLGVAGAVPADLSVAGVRDVAAGVASSGLQHPVDLAEGRLHTPKAPGGECRALGSVRSVPLERRCQSQSGVAAPAPHHVMTSSNTSASAKPAPGIPARMGECRRGGLNVAAGRVTAVRHGRSTHAVEVALCADLDVPSIGVHARDIGLPGMVTSLGWLHDSSSLRFPVRVKSRKLEELVTRGWVRLAGHLDRDEC